MAQSDWDGKEFVAEGQKVSDEAKSKSEPSKKKKARTSRDL